MQSLSFSCTIKYRLDFLLKDAETGTLDLWFYCKQECTYQRAAVPKGVSKESKHLGYKKHHQSDVGREDDC